MKSYINDLTGYNNVSFIVLGIQNYDQHSTIIVGGVKSIARELFTEAIRKFFKDSAHEAKANAIADNIDVELAIPSTHEIELHGVKLTVKCGGIIEFYGSNRLAKVARDTKSYAYGAMNWDSYGSLLEQCLQEQNVRLDIV